MAEGFEFTVSVPIEADLSRFRQQLSAELQSVQQTPATVPVQAGGGGSLAVRPAAPGVAPQAPALAAATTAAVSQASTALATLPAATPNAALAQAVVQAGVPAVVNTGTGQVVAGPGPGGANVVAIPGMGGGPGGGPGRRGLLGGWGIIGAGTLLNAAGNVALAHMDHARAVREAEGDPGALINADIAFQHRAGQSIPIVGHMAQAIREMVTGDIEYSQGTLRAAELQDRATAGRRDTAFARRGILAGPGAQGEIERARVERDSTIAHLADTRAVLASNLANLPEQVTATEYAKIAANRMALKNIDEQIGLARETFSITESRIRAGAEINRLNVGARTAESLDTAAGLNPSDVERRAIVRRQFIETKQTEREDKALLPDIVRAHSAELFAFDRARDRANDLRDIQSASAVRTLELASQGRDFEAGVEQLRGGFRARLQAAGGDRRERVRLEQELNAAEGALYADQARRDRAAQFLLDRNPNAAAMEMETDPMRRRVLAMNQRDQAELRGQALRNRADVSFMEATGQEKSANALDIERRSELEQDAARRAGYSKADQANILQAGLNDLMAYQRQLRRLAEAGSVSETASGGYAPGTGGRRDSSEPVVEALRNVQTSIDQMTTALNALLNLN